MSVAAKGRNESLEIDVPSLDGRVEVGSNGTNGHLASPDGGYIRSQPMDRTNLGPMEVMVDQGVDRALKILKRKLIREGLFKELKQRRYYEKPSEKKKRKSKEAVKKKRKEEMRVRKMATMFA